MGATRRLAAIMFTDMVGYSALTQRDESGAVALLHRHNALLRSVFAEFRGQEIKTVGDAFLVEFASALDATRCAVELQRRLREHDEGAREGDRFQVRIGIHLGDVIHEDQDVLGDAVNIASRMEPLAEPGGICVSEQVFAQVENKLGIRFEELGSTELKNIRAPMRVYRVVLPWERGEPTPAAAAAQGAHRLAVLPFANISPDPNDEFFADGLTEEMITRLSRLPELRVIARTSVMRYRGATKSLGEIGRELRIDTALEGSVRRAGNKLRITVQLIDVRSEEHRWADRYDRELTDILAIQDEICEQVSRALDLRLRPTIPARRGSPPSLEAYTTYLRGRFVLGRRAPHSIRLALRIFEEALQKDPGYAPAHSGIADCYWSLLDQYAVPAEEGLPRLKDAAQRAIALDDSLAEAHASLGFAWDGEFDYARAEPEFLRAIELDPGYAMAHLGYFRLLLDEGRLEEAGREIGLAEGADPLSATVLINASRYHWYAGHDRPAVERLDRALQLQSEVSAHVLFLKTLLYGSRGQTEAGLATLQAYEALPPESEREGAAARVRSLALMNAALGRRDEARQRLAEYLRLSTGTYVPADGLATVYGMLGDTDRFYDYAFASVDDRTATPQVVRYSPLLQQVRADRRFEEYLRRCHLKP